MNQNSFNEKQLILIENNFTQITACAKYLQGSAFRANLCTAKCKFGQALQTSENELNIFLQS